MFFLALIFIAAGFTGLAIATVAAPYLGWVAALLARRSVPANGKSPHASLNAGPITVEVLVAAHNEEKVIEQTLSSLVEAAGQVSRTGFTVKITVGLDHCTDATAQLVSHFAKTSPVAVRAIENPGENGKWNVLNMLVEQSTADWVALVDSGSIWDARLLLAASDFMRAGDVLGVAPSYSPQKSGGLERLNWRLEAGLKKIENRSGGPVSVHGASVLYRRDTLVTAMAELRGKLWLNDDVVIPLTLRLKNPAGRIVYMADHPTGAGWVSDVGVSAELDVEYRRRRRMLIGNIQWVNDIIFPNWNSNIIVALVSARRIFRMFWAYWILFLGLGFSAGAIALCNAFSEGSSQNLNVYLICVALIALVTSVFLRSNWIRRLSMAFISGLQLPRYWKEVSSNGRGVLWL